MTNEEMATAIKNGNKQLQNELWEQIKRFMMQKVAKYYKCYHPLFALCGVNFEDLEQESYFVMLEMIKAYKPEKGFKLLTYADMQFNNYIKRNILGFYNGDFKDTLNSARSLDENISDTDEDFTLADIVEDKQPQILTSLTKIYTKLN